MINFFSAAHLQEVFDKKIRVTATRGIDGLSAKRFFELYPNFSNKISSDIACEKYKFSPYLEKLILKGKGKHPREISIPCVRDRLVLTCALEYLREVYSEFLKPKMANNIIFETKRFI